MKQPLTLIHSLFFTLIILLFCANSSTAEPVNLSLAKKEIKEYHDSGAYEQELTKAILQAQEYITQQAELNPQAKKLQKLALVLDIDETSLSNYDNMVRRDFVATKEQLHQEILAANAPAIKPTLALYRNALNQGIQVFFVTGRPETEREATEENLTKAGYKKWAGLYFRPLDYHQPSIVPFKSKARSIITKKGYTILASIGDQCSDIQGGYAKKGFKLPNPYYYLP